MISNINFIRIEGVGKVTYADGLKSVDVIGYFEFYDKRFFLHRDAKIKSMYVVSELSTGLLIAEGKTENEAVRKAYGILSARKIELYTKIQSHLVKTRTNLTQTNLGVTLWSLLF